jgi:hypothetical protein
VTAFTGLPGSTAANFTDQFDAVKRFRYYSNAGWSSLVARRAHNPEVVGSNPTPATNPISKGRAQASGLFHFWARRTVADGLTFFMRVPERHRDSGAGGRWFKSNPRNQFNFSRPGPGARPFSFSGRLEAFEPGRLYDCESRKDAGTRRPEVSVQIPRALWQVFPIALMPVCNPHPMRVLGAASPRSVKRRRLSTEGTK